MIVVFGHALRAVWVVLGVLLVLLAALTLGARLALPFAAAWKDEIERGLGDYLGRPVAIGELDLAWRGRGPALALREVTLFESETRRASFEELLLDLDLPASALAASPVIEALVLKGAALTLDYAGGGLFDVHGAVHEQASRDGAQARTDAAAGADAVAGVPAERAGGLEVVRWLLDARRVALLDTRVTFVDASGRPLVVRDLDVHAESDGDVHRLRASLALPPALGERLEIGLDVARGTTLEESAGSLWLEGTELHPGAWAALRKWNDGAHAPGSSVAALIERLGRLEAEAGLELWGRWEAGELVRARARLDARALALAERSGTGRTALFDRLSADLVYRDEAPGWSLAADRVELVAGAERAVLEGVEIGRGARETGRWELDAAGERLPFAPIARLASSLLAGSTDAVPAARGVGPALSGALVDWSARVVLEDGRPRVSLAGDVESLVVAAGAALPGVGALDGRIDLADNRGTLSLRAAPLRITRGDAALALDAFALDLALDAAIPDQARVDARATLDGDGIALDARGGLTLAAGHSPRVDLRGRYTVADLAALPPWLALAPIPYGAKRWLSRALVGGRAEDGELVWFGPLEGFPYTDGDGVFRVDARLVDADLAFLSSWPELRGARGRIRFEGRGLEVSADEGELGPLALRRVSARVDHLARPVLALEGSGRGALPSLLDFAVEGPLAARLAPALADARGTGSVDLDLALTAPIGRRARERTAFALDGALYFDGNRLRFDRADLELEGTRGAIGFDERGLRVDKLRATLFGRPVAIEARTEGKDRDALTVIGIDGVLEPREVLAHYGVPLDDRLGGASRWRVRLEVPQARETLERRGLRLVAESDLIGTRVTLPAPLEKRSDETLPVLVESALGDAAAGTLWRLAYGEAARAAFLLDEGGTGALRAVDIALGSDAVSRPLARPDFEGIRVGGRAARVSLDGWTIAIADLVDSLPDEGEEPRPIPPVAVALATEALLAGRVALGPATLRVGSDATHLDATLDNAHLAGKLRYPRAGGREAPPATLALARIDRVLVDALGSAPESDPPRPPLDPRRLPAVDARIARLDWDGIVLEDIELHARPEPRGLTLVGRLRSVGATTLAASGVWRVRGRDADAVTPSDAAAGASAQRSSLELALEGEDIGAALDAAGLEGLLADGTGTLRATLDWDDALYRPTLERLGGSIRLDLERGRIVRVEPGGARLIGLFALQSLPRRLDLDFRDVTADGLAFERLSGDITLAGGVADVELVQLAGPVGIVDVSGTSDLVAREYDQRITVLPRVSAALPLIGVLSGGASAGIGALVAGGFLRALGIDLDRIGLRDYALRGSWDAPTLEPLPLAVRVR